VIVPASRAVPVEPSVDVAAAPNRP
jgi:hypothetical protein